MRLTNMFYKLIGFTKIMYLRLRIFLWALVYKSIYKIIENIWLPNGDIWNRVFLWEIPDKGVTEALKKLCKTSLSKCTYTSVSKKYCISNVCEIVNEATQSIKEEQLYKLYVPRLFISIQKLNRILCRGIYLTCNLANYHIFNVSRIYDS